MGWVTVSVKGKAHGGPCHNSRMSGPTGTDAEGQRFLVSCCPVSQEELSENSTSEGEVDPSSGSDVELEKVAGPK